MDDREKLRELICSEVAFYKGLSDNERLKRAPEIRRRQLVLKDLLVIERTKKSA